MRSDSLSRRALRAAGRRSAPKRSRYRLSSTPPAEASPAALTLRCFVKGDEMLFSLIGLAVVAQAAPALQSFVGRWTCSGSFVRSGKPILSKIDIALDSPSGALVVRHDDKPPLQYHSLEVWSPDLRGGGVQASIADRQNGMRVFHSPPIRNDELVFSRPDERDPAEVFQYKLDAARVMHVEWKIARVGAGLAVGDVLTCRSN